MKLSLIPVLVFRVVQQKPYFSKSMDFFTHLFFSRELKLNSAPSSCPSVLYSNKKAQLVSEGNENSL